MVTILLIILAYYWGRSRKPFLRIIGLALLSYYVGVFGLATIALGFELIGLSFEADDTAQGVFILMGGIIAFFLLYKFSKPQISKDVDAQEQEGTPRSLSS